MEKKWAGIRAVVVLFLGLGLALGVLVVANQASASAISRAEAQESMKQNDPQQLNPTQLQDLGEILPPPPNTPYGIESLSVSILITENGLSPADLTVTVGSTLTWTNQTPQAVHLQTGMLQKAFLPVIVRNSTGNMPLTEPALLPDVLASDTISVTIESGGKFAHTFAETGVYPYFLLSDRYYSGVVNVVDSIPVCGTITQDTRWEYATYLMTCSVEVPHGVTLSVANGAVIKMVGDLYVHGTLTTTGSADQPVIFTSYKDDSADGDTNGDGDSSSPAIGDWGTVVVYSDGAAELEHTLLRYGGAYWGSPYYTGMGNLYNEGGILHMGHVTSTLGAYGVKGSGGTLEVEDSLLSGNSAEGLYINGGAVSISRSILQDNAGHGAYFTNVSAPLITSNAFISNVGKAIYMSMPNIPLDTSQVYSNTVNGNGTNGIWIDGGLSGVSTIDSHLETQPDLPYVFNYLTLNSDAQVNVATGAVIKMNGDLYIHGTLTTTGTADEPVVFTSLKDDSVAGDTNGDGSSTSPATADWRTVFVYGDGKAELEHTLLRYGGAYWGSPYYTNMGNLYSQGGIVHMGHVTSTLGAYGVWGNTGALEVEDSLLSANTTHGIQITGGTVTITGSTLRDNAGHGAYFTNVSAPVISSNAFISNLDKAIYISMPNIPLDTSQVYSNTVNGSGTNAIWIDGGLSGVSTIASHLETQPDLPYVFSYLTLNNGSQVSVADGAVIKMNGDLYIHGTLTTTGTADEPVVFTSLKDDSVGGDTNGDGSSTSPATADWRTVFVYGDGKAELEHTLLRYGGAYWGSPHYTGMGNLYNQGGIVHMGHVTSTLGAYGVWGNTGTLEVEDSLLSGNSAEGLYINGGAVSISRSILQDNAGHGAYFTNVSAPLITSNAFISNVGKAIYMSMPNIPLDTSQVYSNTVNGNGTNGIWIDGGLSGVSTIDSHLETQPDLPYVFNYLTLNSDAQVNVATGAVIKMNGDLYIHGTLTTTGTADEPVVFTSLKDDSVAGDTNGDGSSTSPATADWRTVFVYGDGKAELEHTLLRYGGAYWGSPYYTNMGNLYSQGGIVHMGHVTSTLGAYGVWGNTGALEVEDSLLSANTTHGIQITGGTVTITGSTLRDNAGHGAYFTNVSAPVISSNAFISNLDKAIYISMPNIPLDTSQVYSNTVNGSGTNAIWIDGGLSGVSTIASHLETQPDLPYVFSYLTLNNGSQVSVADGAVIKMNGDLYIHGTLTTTGTADEPVVFTSLKDDSVGGDTNGDGSSTSPATADWRTVFVYGDGKAELEHTLLRYGGAYWGSPHYTGMGNLYNQGGIVHMGHVTSTLGAYGVWGNTGTLEVEDSLLSGNSSWGALLTGSTIATITNSTVRYNPTGIEFSGTISPTITNNSIINNSTWGLNNLNIFTILAENNWWGNASGPTNASNPGGTGDTVSNYVDFTPWLSSAP